jgi:FkbM family methyltransferase
MANKLSVFLKKKLLGKNKNLISLDDSYEVISRLLRGHKVTGILDAGASYGRISEKLLRKFPDANAYAFEPHPDYFQVLKEYAAKDSRFHPQFMALSDTEGKSELYVTSAAGSTSLLMPADRLKKWKPQGSPIVNTIKVDAVTIDGWAQRSGNIPIQLMKFDIQGAELKALQGAVRTLESSTLIVYAEVWFNNMYNGGALYSELDLFLRKYGFLPYDMYKMRYDAKGLIASGCVMFVQAEKLNL